MKVFAWDFHGTLEQGTEVGFAEILKSLAREINYDVTIELEEVRKLFGISVLDYLKHFFPKLSNDEILKLRGRIRTVQNRRQIAKFIKPAPYAEEVLRKIKSAGHHNIVVSTSSQKHLKRFLTVVGLIDYFAAIFGIDRHSLESEFNIAHEKAKVIKDYAQKWGLGSEAIIVIGDRSGDINAGVLIGAKTYQYIQKEFPAAKTKARYKITDLRKILVEI